MTAQEKANKLIESFYYQLPNNGSQSGLCSTTQRWQEAIICALICVDEILESHYKLLLGVNTSVYKHYQDVKKEIEKL